MLALDNSQHGRISLMRKSEADRFWEKVDKSDDCWEWTAYRLNGYGRFGVGGARENGGRIVFAHRWAYEHLVGPIPDGMHLDHLCRNPPCVNPDHLEPVTPKENSLRGLSPWARNARKTHCPQGHPYDDENTIYGGYTGKERRCRECNRLRCEARARAMGVVPKSEWTHCKNGHEWTPENTYWSNLKDGSTRRNCRKCTCDAQRRYQQRKKARG